MSGVHVPLLTHVVRRGVDVAQSYYVAGPNQEYMAMLEQDAEAYENAPPGMSVEPAELLPMIITGIIAMLIIASVRYTVGEVMASLTMIESPTGTAIIEDKPPAYADEPDAPIEKAPLIPSEAEADIEVTLIRHKPITSKITTTVKHLTSIGGFCARWRGLPLSILYHSLHQILTSFFSSLVGAGIVGYSLIYIFVSLGLARLHMVWTHSMIAHPSSKSWWRRMVPRKQCRVILLPTLVFALAQQATFILPIMVAVALGIHDIKQEDLINAGGEKGCNSAVLLMVLRFLAVPATGLFVALAVLLPASVTLTRIEAALLPEDQETIVPFDRFAITGDFDVTARGAPNAIFVQAWRSFDRAARWRLIKLYAKMVLIQFTVAVTAFHLVIAEIYLIGSERLALVCKSGIAQLRLAAIEAQQTAVQAQ